MNAINHTASRNAFLFSNYYFLLLPLFFIVHSVSDNYHPSLIPTALKLWGIITTCVAALYYISFLFFRHTNKAAFITVLIAIIYLFFAPLQDLIRLLPFDSTTAKYSVLIPTIFLALVATIITTAKTKSSLSLINLYLKWVLVFLIIIEIVRFISACSETRLHISQDIVSLKKTNVTTKPDIYFIVADEYAGNQQLTELFNFDNKNFTDLLQQRGFYVADKSISNYNATVFSMASMLNLQYLQHMQDTIITHKKMLAGRSLINQSIAGRFFENEGYEMYNYSFFDFQDLPPAIRNPYYATHEALLMRSTFYNRANRDLWFNFADKKDIDNSIKKHDFNNKRVEQLVLQNVQQKSSRPKFIYAHFSLPHHPFYYDKDGREIPTDSLTDLRSTDKAAYINYLQYGNNIFLQLIDSIFKHSTQPPIIVFMSDHGFRQFMDTTAHRYYFMTMNAVYFPDRKYDQFYRGISAVNQFRVVLNSQFQQQLPMLNDSTTFLIE